MTVINLVTHMQAPTGKCFDLARSVEAHQESANQTSERVVAGRTSGLCEFGDAITWEARHFGIRQQLSVKITQMHVPFFFEDVMIKGAFKSMKHMHTFEQQGDVTQMIDAFQYEVPFGFAGGIFDTLVLKRYMTGFLLRRNAVLKSLAEK